MSDYIKDPNDRNKQIPGHPPYNYYDRASNPPAGSFARTPNYVIIGKLAGNVGFFLGSSASFASKNDTPSAMDSSSHFVSFGAPVAGTQLNINPYAWSGSVGDIVTFVYKGGLDGHGR